MDNHDRKRLLQIGKALAETFAIIRVILMNLDQIALRQYVISSEVREQIADDLNMVARDILPTVEAPMETLSILRSVLVDWVILNDLVTLSRLAEPTPRRLDAMEETAERMVLVMDLLRETAPELLGDIE